MDSHKTSNKKNVRKGSLPTCVPQKNDNLTLNNILIMWLVDTKKIQIFLGWDLPFFGHGFSTSWLQMFRWSSHCTLEHGQRDIFWPYSHCVTSRYKKNSDFLGCSRPCDFLVMDSPLADFSFLDDWVTTSEKGQLDILPYSHCVTSRYKKNSDFLDCSRPCDFLCLPQISRWSIDCHLKSNLMRKSQCYALEKTFVHRS